MSPGSATLKIERVAGRSVVTSTHATNPLKLLAPRPRGEAVWAYLSSFGGGVVAGDHTRLDIQLSPGSRCFVGSQASTKIYRNPEGLDSGHETHAALMSSSLLVLAPDPIQPFAGSRYHQQQAFHLAADANLALVEVVSAGRCARGERWAFTHFSSRIDVQVNGRRVLLDSLRLTGDDTPLSTPHRTGRFHCFASLLLIGPLLAPIARQQLESVATTAVTYRGRLVLSASPIGAGVLVRLAGESVETALGELRQRLAPLTPFLGDDPWSRKW